MSATAGSSRPPSSHEDDSDSEAENQRIPFYHQSAVDKLQADYAAQLAAEEEEEAELARQNAENGIVDSQDEQNDDDANEEGPDSQESQVFDPESAAEDDAPRPKLKRYKLRKNIDRTSFRGTGHVDKDETGEYDPETDFDLEAGELDEIEERERRRERDRERRRKKREEAADRVMDERMEEGIEDEAQAATLRKKWDGKSNPKKKVAFELPEVDSSSSSSSSDDDEDRDEEADVVNTENLMGELEMGDADEDEDDEDIEMIYDDAGLEPSDLEEPVVPSTPRRSKRKASAIATEKMAGLDASSEDSEENEEDEEEADAPPAPRKRVCSRSTPSTPTRRQPARAASAAAKKNSPRAKTRAPSKRAASKAAPKPKQYKIAQDCKFCKDNRSECSIAMRKENESDYPCELCQQNGYACAMFDPRTKQQKDGSAKAWIVIEAADKRKKKEAAKKNRQILRDQELKVRELAKYLSRKKSCTACEGEKRTCSWSKKGADLTSDCKFCVKEHRICELHVTPEYEQALKMKEAADKNDGHFDALGFLTPEGRKVKRRKHPQPPHPEPMEVDAPEVVEVIPNPNHPIPPGYARMQIMTSFVHPISFNHPAAKPRPGELIETDPSENCKFHLTWYPIFGEGTVRPHVTYPLEDNISKTHPYVFHEIPGTGGHADSGKDSTTLCRGCTFSRQKILFCPSHKIKAIEGIPKMAEFNFDRAYASLTSDLESRGVTDSAANKKNAPGGWCAICPSPAFFECCAPVGRAFQVKGQSREGCGLKLCDMCAINMIRTEVKGSGERKCKALLKDAYAHNKAKAAYMLDDEISDEMAETLTQDLKSFPAEIGLDALVELAKKEAKEKTTMNGVIKYQDGLRADCDLITKGDNGWLHQWMAGEAKSMTAAAYKASRV